VNAAFYPCSWLDSRKTFLENFVQPCLPETNEYISNGSTKVSYLLLAFKGITLYLRHLCRHCVHLQHEQNQPTIIYWPNTIKYHLEITKAGSVSYQEDTGSNTNYVTSQNDQPVTEKHLACLPLPIYSCYNTNLF